MSEENSQKKDIGSLRSIYTNYPVKTRKTSLGTIKQGIVFKFGDDNFYILELATGMTAEAVMSRLDSLISKINSDVRVTF